MVVPKKARAGKTGSGMLLVAPFEERSMVKDLSDMPLVRLTVDPQPFVERCRQAQNGIRTDAEFKKNAEQAYAAWLGFYNGNLRKCGWDKPKLVEMANWFSTTMLLPEVPFLEKKTVGKMGLKGVPGLRVR